MSSNVTLNINCISKDINEANILTREAVKIDLAIN